MTAYDIAVIGLGAVGSAALLAAARAGVRAIGFDRFAPPHDLGSTHGETRIVRSAIGENSALSPIAMRSFELWDALERETGSRVLNRCGVLVLPTYGGPDMHMAADFLEKTIQAAQAYGVPFEVLDAAEVRKRFPAFSGFQDGAGYFEPGAGYGDPERSVAAHLARAKALGAALSLSNPVQSIEPDSGGGLRLATAQGPVRTARAILAAGAWTPGFLPEAWSRVLTVSRQIMHWVEAEPFARYQAPAFPPFIWRKIYGFPAQGGRADGLKIATESLQDVTAPDDVRRTASAAEVQEFLGMAQSQFPGIRRVVKSKTCLYTATPDLDFLIGLHPEMAGLTIISACSGHGFKHAPALGEAVVEASLGRQPLFDLAPFSPARFGL